MFIFIIGGFLAFIGFSFALKLDLWIQAIVAILSFSWYYCEVIKDRSGNWPIQMIHSIWYWGFWMGAVIGNIYYFCAFETNYSISGSISWFFRP